MVVSRDTQGMSTDRVGFPHSNSRLVWPYTLDHSSYKFSTKQDNVECAARVIMHTNRIRSTMPNGVYSIET